MKLAVIILLLLLTSCGQQKDPREALKETPQNSTGQPSKPVFQQVDGDSGSPQCIDGARYDILYGGAFLQFKDGKYITC